MLLIRVFYFLLWSVLAVQAGAQQGVPVPGQFSDLAQSFIKTPPPSCEKIKPGQPSAKPPVLIKVSLLAAADSGAKEAHTVSLRDQIVVTLGQAVDFHNCLMVNGADAVLFLDHVPLADVKPRSTSAIGNDSLEIVFRLERSSANSTAWNELLLRNWVGGGRPRPVSIGIGPSPSYESVFRGSSNKFQLNLGFGGPCLAGVVLAVTIVLGVALFRSSAVADRSWATEPSPHAERFSFSLARTMLMCWVLTTTAAIGLAFINSGAIPPLDGGMSLLMLASGVTVGSGAVIDHIRNIVFKKSDGPWIDLVKDADGLALHRLQAVGVNVLLLVVVWTDLISRGSIVTLDKSWAALMGISSGVYLYGKTTESLG